MPAQKSIPESNLPNSNGGTSSSSSQHNKRKSNEYDEHQNKVLKKSHSYRSDSDEEVARKNIMNQHLKIDEAECGIIEKVTLRNFMCHSNLEFEFGPHVNFITGRNGSGKSAVLNALMLALGSRSSTTGRSTNLAGFIQTGKQCAVINVTIRNCGAGAYLTEKYGNFITIERRITLDNRGAYKIKDQKGKIISSKREDLNNILMALNIQVDNPVGVLTQEGSKSFLELKDLKKRYDLFFKATNLEKVKEAYDDLSRRQKILHSLLVLKQNILPEIEKDVEKCRQKVKKFKRCQSQYNKITDLRKEVWWAKVRDAEEGCQEHKTKVEELYAKVDKTSKNINRFEEEMVKINKKINDLKQKELEFKSEIQNHQNNYNIFFKKYKDVDCNIRLLRVKDKGFSDNINKIKKEISSLEQNLHQLNQRSQEDFDKEIKKREEQIKNLESDKHKLQNKREALYAEIENHFKNIKNAENNISLIRPQLVDLKNKKTRLESDMLAMKNGLKNELAVYGPKMPLLISKIKTVAKSFHKLPIGPIGLYIKIKEKKWLFAVERCLSSKFLISFCCDNEKDRGILKQIMKEIFGTTNLIPPIIMCFFTDMPYSDVRCVQSPGNSTVYDMVICNNPVVLNCLVDQRAIESVLLMENVSVAMNIMMSSPPRKCLCAYTIQGDQIYPSPNYRYYSCKAKPNNRLLLQPYGQNEIKKAEQLCDEYAQSIKVKMNEEEMQRKILNMQKEELNYKKEKENNLKKQIMLTSQKIGEVEAVSMNQPDVTSLTEEMSNQNILLKKMQSEQTDIKNEIESLKSELDVIKEKKKDAENDFTETKSKWETIGKELDQLSQEKAKNEKHKDISCSQLSKEQQQLAAIEKELKRAKEIVQNCLLDAESHGRQRINTRRKVEDLESQIEEIESLVNQEFQNVNLDEEIQKLKDKENMLSKTKNQITSLFQSLNILKERFDKRYEKFQNIIRIVSCRVKYLFIANMRSRGFSGRLKFDHKNHSLGILAYTRFQVPEKNSKVFNNIHNLSGGERSFVTVSLLMALSEVSEIPFHILDEYDVFMDALNKEQSLKMMIDKANEQRNNQFIFLSPLELHSYAFTQPHLVKIHKMEDPERSNVK